MDFNKILDLLHFKGVIIGACTFIIIGVCHPLVIWAEYYLTKKSWWLFFIGGMICAIISLFIEDVIYSCLLASLGFSLLWGIGEVLEQENRVLRGWHKENPKRHDYYEALREEQRKKGKLK